MMYGVYAVGEAEDVLMATFETVTEANNYIEEIEAADMETYGAVVDEMFVGEVE